MYTVIEYNPRWRKQFEAEAKRLRSILGVDALAIEHIGSTAVPGLAGKPTIDVLVLVANIAVADQYRDAMERSGYSAHGAYVTPESRLFTKDMRGTRVVNIHFFSQNHRHGNEMLAVRSYFTQHPQDAERYGTLKKTLFRKYPENYGAYRKAKDKYLEQLIRKHHL